MMPVMSFYVYAINGSTDVTDVWQNHQTTFHSQREAFSWSAWTVSRLAMPLRKCVQHILTCNYSTKPTTLCYCPIHCLSGLNMDAVFVHFVVHLCLMYDLYYLWQFMEKLLFVNKDVNLEFFHNRSSNRYNRLKTGHRLTVSICAVAYEEVAGMDKYCFARHAVFRQAQWWAFAAHCIASHASAAGAASSDRIRAGTSQRSHPQ